MINLKKQKSLVLLTILLTLSTIMIGCQSNQQSVIDEVYETTIVETEEIKNEESKPEANEDHKMVQFEMEDGGIMVFELYPEYAPETVANFVKLTEEGFYDGLRFHRIIKGFMAQGGDPIGDGTGGSEENITGEFASNDFPQNTLKHTRGVISMARSYSPNSASSQFFIMDGEAVNLDGNYAAFGMLIEGDETLTVITDTEVERNPNTKEVSMPTEDVIIKAVTVIN